MSSRTFLTSLLLLLLATAISVLSTAGSGGRRVLLVGGWEPVKDLNDQHIQEIASFAVGAYNSKSNARLSLMRVKSGEYQVVQGTNYRLVISATDGAAAAADYVAIVWDKLDHSMQLISFSAVKIA